MPDIFQWTPSELVDHLSNVFIELSSNLSGSVRDTKPCPKFLLCSSRPGAGKQWCIKKAIERVSDSQKEPPLPLYRVSYNDVMWNSMEYQLPQHHMEHKNTASPKMHTLSNELFQSLTDSSSAITARLFGWARYFSSDPHIVLFEQLGTLYPASSYHGTSVHGDGNDGYVSNNTSRKSKAKQPSVEMMENMLCSNVSGEYRHSSGDVVSASAVLSESMAQLITQVSTLSHKHPQCCVIATLTSPLLDRSLHPILLKYGFDLVVHLQPPTFIERIHMIGEVFKSSQLEESEAQVSWETLSSLAVRCGGLVPHEISSFARRAAQLSIKEVSSVQIPPKSSIPSSMSKLLDFIAGLSQPKKILLSIVDSITKGTDITTPTTSLSKRCVLLYGVPGTGKTMLAQAIAQHAGFSFHPVDISNLIQREVGASELRLHQLFVEAIQYAPSIIFLDEVQAVFRQSRAESMHDQRLLKAFLCELDHLATAQYNPTDPTSKDRMSVSVIAATNAPELLDPSVTCHGRLDTLLHIPPPTIREALDYVERRGHREWHMDLSLCELRRCLDIPGTLTLSLGLMIFASISAIILQRSTIKNFPSFSIAPTSFTHTLSHESLGPQFLSSIPYLQSLSHMDNHYDDVLSCYTCADLKAMLNLLVLTVSSLNTSGLEGSDYTKTESAPTSSAVAQTTSEPTVLLHRSLVLSPTSEPSVLELHQISLEIVTSICHTIHSVQPSAPPEAVAKFQQWKRQR